MSRSGKIPKRNIKPDPVYNSRLVARFINRVMRSGKKTVAQKQVYKALELVNQKTNQDPLLVFRVAIENIKPIMEVRARRVGGAAYQVPISVRSDRKQSLAIRWLIEYANQRPNKEYHTYAEKLAAELIDAANSQGLAMKKKEITHKMAEANKAFAHFRW
jgi:small subunit ribosomal protein S7